MKHPFTKSTPIIAGIFQAVSFVFKSLNLYTAPNNKGFAFGFVLPMHPSRVLVPCRQEGPIIF